MTSLNSKKKLKLFYEILRIRRIEEMISKKYQEMKMRCPVHLSIGQEAIAVGISALLSKRDQVVSNHRSHAHYISKGGNLKRMISEIYGKKDGCNSGRGGSMNLIDKDVNFMLSLPIVGSTIPLGVGLSFEKKIRNKKELVIIYLGDAATEQGIFYESLNFAKLQNLKCLFVIENNFYSVYTNIKDRRGSSNLDELENILKIKTYREDGNKVLSIMKTADSAINYVKMNSKPAIVIMNTFRYLEHCGPNNDDNLDYREKKEIEFWNKKCPLMNIKELLLKENILDHLKILKYEKKIEKELKEIFNQVELSNFPSSRSSFDNVYAK
jgi:TPP-dependent pyruvate/acetoin dehydrogenase alpha subunit